MSLSPALLLRHPPHSLPSSPHLPIRLLCRPPRIASALVTLRVLAAHHHSRLGFPSSPSLSASIPRPVSLSSVSSNPFPSPLISSFSSSFNAAPFHLVHPRLRLSFPRPPPRPRFAPPPRHPPSIRHFPVPSLFFIVFSVALALIFSSGTIPLPCRPAFSLPSLDLPALPLSFPLFDVHLPPLPCGPVLLDLVRNALPPFRVACTISFLGCMAYVVMPDNLLESDSSCTATRTCAPWIFLFSDSSVTPASPRPAPRPLSLS
ncbi:hypothetical protein DFH08DRAFT_1082508 [Mycena albidolilacea]|uniref:Uncharacterized protein n=1 Tax=Mycena albidolilacea TaxID=1033008 RepID=A0AAD6ZUH9_9AGAR|nr:hypothetical protein DFH08DRAFT_1082508 [Mycena albidolilacea]